MAHPKVKISDDSGNTVDVTGNALDVNLASGANIDIGDVEIKGHSVVLNVSLTVNDTATRLLATIGGCKHVDIMSSVANTGIIYIGASNLTAAKGIALYPGDIYSVDVTDTDLLYALAIVDSETLQIVTYD